MNSKHQNVSFWEDPKKRAFLFQIILFSIIGLACFELYSNAKFNLEKQNIATGFEFLENEAGFEISESVIEYWSDESYQKALTVGVLNTLKVAVIGNLLAVILGILIGIARLSPNWALSKMALSFIEVMRNTPLLLQLFFWYALLTEVLPTVGQALNPLPHVFLSQRGLAFPVFSDHQIWNWVWAGLGVALMASFVIKKIGKIKKEKTGQEINTLLWSGALVICLPLIIWIIGGAPSSLNTPSLEGFNFEGGYTLGPEFISLMTGLVLYSAAFNAEIVRAGILSVSKGQWEASESLGLSRTQTMGLVILPQARRVMIPPMTSQVLNLTKNSSLAVGIGYPDFVSVANTTMNQTGQAIEVVMLIMGVYLFFSITTSLLMNWYNKLAELKER